MEFGSPLFTVVIPFARARRGHRTLMRAVDSCLEQENVDFEIRIVTNLPDPQIERILLMSPDPRVHLHCARRVGVNSARNLGAREARGRFILFLDDDCQLPESDFLSRLERFFSCYPQYSAIGGPYSSLPGARWRARGYNALANAWCLPDRGSEFISDSHNLLGGNICLRREVFAAGHYFSEEIISGGDETEFLRRLKAAGYALGFSEELVVKHSADASWEGVVARAWNQGRARSKRKLRTPATPAAKRAAFLGAVRREPRLLPFSVVHFSALYLAETSPKLAGGIEKMGKYKKQEYVPAQSGPTAQE